MHILSGIQNSSIISHIRLQALAAVITFTNKRDTLAECWTSTQKRLDSTPSTSPRFRRLRLALHLLDKTAAGATFALLRGCDLVASMTT